MTTMTTNTPTHDPAAAADLHRILDTIAASHSRLEARDAALTLRTAVVEGRIDGGSYGIGADGCACVIGHLADALHVDVYAALLDWRGPEPEADALSPVERLVGVVGPGDRPETSPDLAALLAMLDDWLSAAEMEVQSC